jgi:hypothetical protein
MTDRPEAIDGFGVDIGTETTALARTRDGETTLYRGADTAGSEAVVATVTDIDADSPADGAEAESSNPAGERRPLPWYRADGSDRGDWTGDALADVLSGVLERRGLESELAGESAVAVVPGAYPDAARDQVERAVERASGADATAVRSPVPVVAAAPGSLSDPTIYLAVDIGAHWTDTALVETGGGDGPPVTVHARSSRPGCGTDRFATALVEWTVRTAARDAGIDPEATVALPDADRDRLRTAVADVLEAWSGSGEHPARVTLDEPVTVSVNGGADEREVTIDRRIDGDAAADALDSVLSEVGSTVEELFGLAPHLSRTDIDRTVIAGGATGVPGVEDRISAAGGDAPVRTPNNPLVAPAGGASKLASDAVRAGIDPSDLVAEATASAVDVARVDDGGVAADTLAPQGSPRDRPYTIELTTAVDQQRRGRVDLVDRDRLTGERDRRRTVLVTGIPPGPAGDVTLELSWEPATDDLGVSVTDPEGSASVDLLDDPEDADLVNTAWLAAPGSDPAESVARGSDAAPRVAPDPPEWTDGAPSTRALVERLWDARTLLWNAQRQGTSMSPDELRSLLNSLDAAFRRFDIEPIEPDPGSPTDPLEHREFMEEPASYPEGRVVEVQRPGILLDDTPVEPAQVIVASEQTPTEPESDEVSGEADEPPEETEEAAEAPEETEGNEASENTEEAAGETAEAADASGETSGAN